MNSSALISFLLSLLSLLPYSATEAEPSRLVIEPVGVVKQHYVTNREVQIHHLVGEALFNEGPAKLKLALLDPGSESFRIQLNAVLLEWMVYYEARSFGMEPVSDSVLNGEYQRIMGKLNQSKSWQGLEVGGAEGREYVERALLAKKFIEFKEESSRVPITDEEARKYYMENPKKYVGHSYEYFARSIKVVLRKEQANYRLLEWFRVLESKYKAKSLVGTFHVDEKSAP